MNKFQIVISSLANIKSELSPEKKIHLIELEQLLIQHELEKNNTIEKLAEELLKEKKEKLELLELQEILLEEPEEISLPPEKPLWKESLEYLAIIVLGILFSVPFMVGLFTLTAEFIEASSESTEYVDY